MSDAQRRNSPGWSEDASRGRGAARAASERRAAGVAREATANAPGDASAIADIVRERTEAGRGAWSVRFDAGRG